MPGLYWLLIGILGAVMNAEQVMALADAYAELNAHVEFLKDQGTPREMKHEFPKLQKRCVEARAALEAAVTQGEPVANHTKMANDALRQAANRSYIVAKQVAEAMQEPVAYRHLHEDGWEYYDSPTGEDCTGCQPLYTHPAPSVNTALLDVVKRIRQWDALDIPDTDGAFWKRELDAAIAAAEKEK